MLGASLVAFALTTTLAVGQAAAPPPPPSTPRPGPPAAPPAAGAPPVDSPPAAEPAPAPAATPVPAPAYPPTAPDPWLATQNAEFQRLQAATGLELSGTWSDYIRERRTRTFYEFTRTRYRRRLGMGIGFTIGGLGLAAAGMAMVLLAADKSTDAGEIDVIGGAMIMTGGLGLLIPGAILWPINQVRLSKLRKAGPAQTARLRALGPLALPRGAGLGLGLAF